jgi:hypothetical protein
MHWRKVIWVVVAIVIVAGSRSLPREPRRYLEDARDSCAWPISDAARPDQALIPTVNIASAKGWPEGARPTAASGLEVKAFASPSVNKIGAATEGRRLTPVELVKVAAEMGLPVSGDRYRPDNTGVDAEIGLR